MSGRVDFVALTPDVSASFPTSGSGYRQFQSAYPTGSGYRNGAPFVAKHVLIRVSSPVSDQSPDLSVRFSWARNAAGTLIESLQMRPGNTAALDGIRISEISSRVASGTVVESIYVTAWTDGGQG